MKLEKDFHKKFYRGIFPYSLLYGISFIKSDHLYENLLQECCSVHFIHSILHDDGGELSLKRGSNYPRMHQQTHI